MKVTTSSVFAIPRDGAEGQVAANKVTKVLVQTSSYFDISFDASGCMLANKATEDL